MWDYLGVFKGAIGLCKDDVAIIWGLLKLSANDSFPEAGLLVLQPPVIHTCQPIALCGKAEISR